jgi:hypothetical protein
LARRERRVEEEDGGVVDAWRGRRWTVGCVEEESVSSSLSVRRLDGRRRAS